ncbi:uncharacterized protein LOC143281733 [Babylonia areolata]|uniref:uncharacterized protein LOC143281733 n=1 Tax=Babylonia areolata TaxID=304850 RepID=UPI003FD5FD7A
MAGPEDSTTSSHHHGNPPDTPDLRLQEDSEADQLKGGKHNVPQTDPSSPRAVDNNCPPNTTTDTDTVLQKIDLREGKVKRGKTEAPQTPDPHTTKPVCEDDDVFDVNRHPHLFFIEDDDDEDTQSEEEEEEEEGSGTDAFVDSDNKEKKEAETNSKGERLPDNACDRHHLGDENRHGPPCPQDNICPRDVPRSSPWNIPPRSASPLTTVCRCSHSAQVVVRCQISSTCSDLRKTSSCPAAFSPRWPQVVSSADRGSAGNEQRGRKRHSTVSGTKRDLDLSTRPQGGHDLDPSGDDPTQATLRGRSRSYSDSDVQRLLIKDISGELRRIGDEFDRSRGHRLTRPRVSEPIIEENVCEM